MGSCQLKRFKTCRDYRCYIEDPSNGLKKIKSFEEVNFIVKNIPAQLRVLQEREQELVMSDLDSVMQEYAQSLVFQFSIIPGEKCTVRDLRYYGIYTDDDYMQRQKVLNYYMSEYFILRCNDRFYTPKICHLEQDYGVSGKLNFLLVFVPDDDSDVNTLSTAKEIKIEFNDPFFNTHLTKFIFSNKDLKAVPKIEI
ncbi:hypothetical protein DMA11_18015 [Marinilabiliaceae bacterium JC017]|nr:hypothetical protein DMA11_18015 [Marinilabiliaceae bacterium JC017]